MDGLPYRVFQLLYFMLPAYAANMTPPFMKYWKGSNPPITRRLLGAHKTVPGFASGAGAAVLVTFLQSRIGWDGSIVREEPWLDLGLHFGVGATVSLVGDIVVNHLGDWLGILDTKW